MAGTKALPQDAVIALYLSMALLLLFARALGELARKLKQPAIIGEILAGIILGKTVLGRVWPQLWVFMFGPSQAGSTAIATIASVGSTLFMLVAGLEMDLDKILAKKSRPLIVGFCSVLVPFALGFGVTYAAPEAMGMRPGQDVAVYSLLCGTAFAITAMPVVAKTLRDVGLFRTPIGQVVMSSATVDDLIGWSLFAVVLSLSTTENGIPALGVGGTIAIDVVFVFFIVIFGRLAFPRLFLWIQATFSFPGGIIGFVLTWTFSVACLATYIGLHNTLGAFLVGASLSNNKYLRSSTKEVIDHFVTYSFAPIFFGYIAIGADFVADFDAALIAIVLTIACVGKLTGATIGARLSGSGWRESFAVATCMNSRGAMEILLANVALAAGVINNRMFVALVFMAIVTSLLPGPVLRRILKRKERQVFTVYMPNPTGFIPELVATDMESAITALCAGLKCPELVAALVNEEHIAPSGNTDQIALTRLQVPNLRHPKIAVGISKTGIDFSGQFGYPGEHPQFANIIIICLFPDSTVPGADASLEDDIVQQISLVFSRQAFRNEFMKTTRFLEVLSLINFETHRHGLHSTQEEIGSPHVVKPSSLPDADRPDEFGLDSKNSTPTVNGGGMQLGQTAEVLSADNKDKESFQLSPV